MNEFLDCSLMLVKAYSATTVYIITSVKGLATGVIRNPSVQSEQLLVLERRLLGMREDHLVIGES